MQVRDAIYSLAETLPHGAGFTLLDTIVEYGEDYAVCSVRVKPTSLFFEAGRGVPSWVAIEYMAQTIAVYGGITRLQRGKPVQIALLLGTQTMECRSTYFRAGEELTIRIHSLVLSATGVGVFRCELHDESGLQAKADIKAYQPEDISDYLEQLRKQAP